MVSGGHSYVLEMEGMGRYRVLGQTLDDAAGECLDKGANLLGLGYPGGPAIEKAAAGGDAGFVKFPQGLEHSKGGKTEDGLDLGLCFSFSGLKTSLRYYLEKNPGAREGHLADLAASFQEAVTGALAARAERAIAATGASGGGGEKRGAAAEAGGDGAAAEGHGASHADGVLHGQRGDDRGGGGVADGGGAGVAGGAGGGSDIAAGGVSLRSRVNWNSNGVRERETTGTTGTRTGAGEVHGSEFRRIGLAVGVGAG